MGILDDIRHLNVNVDDPAAVASAIRRLAADPATRVQLAREWEAATGQTFPPELFTTFDAP